MGANSNLVSILKLEFLERFTYIFNKVKKVRNFPGDNVIALQLAQRIAEGGIIPPGTHMFGFVYGSYVFLN